MSRRVLLQFAPLELLPKPLVRRSCPIVAVTTLEIKNKSAKTPSLLLLLVLECLIHHVVLQCLIVPFEMKKNTGAIHTVNLQIHKFLIGPKIVNANRCAVE